MSAGRWLKKDQSHANRPIFAGRWRKIYQLSAVDSLRGKEIRSLRPVWQEGIHGMPGEVGEEKKLLLRTTKEALYKGIENAVAGRHIGDIGAAVQDHCEAQGYGIVRELTGHGIGHEMHEDPQVPNYGRRGNGVMLKASMCIAIEPMVTMGKREIYLDSNDRWTIRTRDGKPAAHFEHTVAVRKGKAEILSSFEEIETIEGKLY